MVQTVEEAFVEREPQVSHEEVLDIFPPAAYDGATNGWGEGYSTLPVIVREGDPEKTGDFAVYNHSYVEWPWTGRYITRLTAACRCGTAWYRDRGIDDKEQEHQCPSCGCRQLSQNTHTIESPCFLFEDPDKIAVVGFHRTFAMKSHRGIVNGSSHDVVWEPGWLYPVETKWRVTHNWKSGKTTLVLLHGKSRRKVVLPLFGKSWTGMGEWYQYLCYADRSVLAEFIDRLVERLPEYVVREHGFDKLSSWVQASEGTVSNDTRTLQEMLFMLFDLHAYPHLWNAGQLFIVPRSISERRAIEAANGQIAMHRVVFPALTKKTMGLMKQVAGNQTGGQLELLSLVRDPNLFRTGLGQLDVHSRGYRSGTKTGNLTIFQLKHPVTHRHSFVRDLFGDTKMFERRLREGRVSFETIRLATDSLRTYTHLRKKMTAKELRAYVSDLKGGTIQQVHDGLSRKHWEYNNREIVYHYSDKEQEQYMKTCGEVHFRLPRSSYELKDISAYMKNCVSGYGENMDKRESFIVTGYVADEPYVCIGILPKTGEVFEIKARFNKRLESSDPHLQDIISYVRSHTESPDEIYDLRHLYPGPRKDEFGLPRGGIPVGPDDLPF